jgi:hypothetical protein
LSERPVDGEPAVTFEPLIGLMVDGDYNKLKPQTR